MAARKKRKQNKVENGGRRPNSGRKSVEYHFEALNKRLDILENGLASVLKYVVPSEQTKTTYKDCTTNVPVGNGADERQKALPLYVPEPDESAAPTQN